jgi:radical SAM-linked protein
MSDFRPPAPFRPVPELNDPDRLGRVLTERVLPLVARPARYVGGELGADRTGWDPERINVLLAFPDVYEVGMSHLGLRLLYRLVNAQPGAFADLAFAPWPDCEREQRRFGLPLFGLQSRRPAAAFDLLGFSLGYELGYTNLLTMIDLAGLPLLAAERRESDPLVVAGGVCTLNPAVVGPYCDLLLLGDGEDALRELVIELATAKTSGEPRAERLRRARSVTGAWFEGCSEPVRPRIVADLGAVPPADLVTTVEPVHDRVTVEVMRGCTRGCRFCQAGMVNRPVRERAVDRVVAATQRGVATSGQAEASFLALSAADYGGLTAAVTELQRTLDGTRTNLVLPSLRADTVSAELAERIGRERPASFTLAPEAGSQRLRDVVNKQLSEEQIISAVEQAFAGGIKRVKLYFMIGLPTETDADLEGIVALVGRIIAVAPHGGRAVTVAVSPFVPKAHTPFQWAGQIPREEIARRNRYLESRLRRFGIKLALRDPEESFLEAVTGLGDRDVGLAVREAWWRGARFDAWSEYFAPGIWAEAFAAGGVEPNVHVAPRDPADPLPWDGVDGPVSRDFLRADWERALKGRTLPDCRLTRTCFDCEACSDGLEHVAAAVAELCAEDRAGSGDDERRRPAPPASPTNAASGRRWQVWRRQAAEKCWHRIEYEKCGDAIFLGHLDFQRQFQLALRRSGLPLAYSKGYHPHPLLKHGPPLPVGVAGSREALDVALGEACPELTETLNAQLPAGVRVRRAAIAGGQTPPSVDQFVARYEYRIALPPPAEGGPAPSELRERIAAFLASAHWPYVRQRSKGEVEIDVRRLVADGGLTWQESESNGATATVLRAVLEKDERGAILPVHEFLTSLLEAKLAEPRWARCRRVAYHGRDRAGCWRTPFEQIVDAGRRTWLLTRWYG